MVSIFKFAAHLERSVKEALRDSAEYAANEIKRGTPDNLKRTRDAVFFEQRGLQARVGLRFAQRYPANGTRTQRRLQQQWKILRPQIRERFVRHLAESLK